MSKKKVAISGVSNSIVNTGTIGGNATNNSSPGNEARNDEEVQFSQPFGSQLPDRREIHRIISNFFNEEEIRDLCFDMNIDYEQLGGANKTGKARELIIFTEHHNKYTELVQHIVRLRPHSLNKQ